LVAAVSADGSEVAVINAPLCLRSAAYTIDVGKTGKIVAAAFSQPPVGKPESSPLLLAVTTTNLLISIDLDGGGRATVLAENIHRNAVRAISVSPDGSLIATGGQDRFVRLWQLHSSGELAKPLTYIAHAATVNKLQFDHRGVSLVSIGEDETVLLWELKREASETANVSAAVAAATTEMQVLSPQAAPETQPASASVAAGFPPTPATVRGKATTAPNQQNATSAESANAHRPPFSTVAMLESSTDSVLAQLHPQKGLQLVDLQTKVVKALPSSRNVQTFVVDGKSQLLAAAETVAGPDDVAMIELWRCGTGDASPAIRMPSLRYHDQGIAAIEFLSDGLLVSVGVNTEGCVVVWDTATGVVLKAAAMESSVRGHSP
jgi:WD40 repeat protein